MNPKEKNTQKQKKSKHWFKKLLRILLYTLFGLIFLLALLILLIRSPTVQQWITDKATDYVSEQTGTVSSVDKLYLTFRGNIWLEGVYLEDLEGDTLLYSKTLEAGLAIRPLFNNELKLTKFDWTGVVSRVKRDDTGVYNFDFLIDAFVDDDPKPEKAEEVTPWEILMESVRMRQFDFSFDDRYEGTEMHLRLNEVDLNPRVFSTDQAGMDFSSISADGLSFHLIQRAPSPHKIPEDVPDFESEEGEIFPLNIASLTLNAIEFKMIDSVAKTRLELSLEEHQSRELSLFSKDSIQLIHHLEIGRAHTEGLTFLSEEWGEKKPELAKEEVHPEETTAISFDWPNWVVETGELTFFDHYIQFKQHHQASTPGRFNPSDMDLSLDTLIIPSLTFKEKSLNTQLKSLVASDHSGLEIRKFGFDLIADDTAVKIDDLEARTAFSELIGNLEVTYSSIEELINHPEKAHLILNLEKMSLSPRDIALIDPSLTTGFAGSEITHYPINLTAEIEGNAEFLNIKTFSARLANNTRIRVNGELRNVLDADKLSYNAPYIYLYTTERDLALFIPPDTTYRLPSTLFVVGHAKGTGDQFSTTLDVKVPHGDLHLSGEIKDLSTIPVYHLDADLKTLDVAFYTDSLGPENIAGQIEISGRGFDRERISADLKLSLTELLYKGHQLSPLEMQATLKDETLAFQLDLDSENIALQMSGSGSMDTTAYSFDFISTVRHLDLKALEMEEEDFLASAVIRASGQGNTGVFDGHLRLDDLVVEKSEATYRVDSLMTSIFFDPQSSQVDINSPLLSAGLTANRPPDEVFDGLWAHLNSYWGTDFSDTLLVAGLEVDLNLRIPQTEFLTEVILPGLEEMEDIELDLNYRESSKTISGTLRAPYIHHAGTELEGFYGNVNSVRDSLEFSTGFDRVAAGPADLVATHISGFFDNSVLYTKIDMGDEDVGQMILMGIEWQYTDDTLDFHIQTEDLVFNNYDWRISSGNRIIWAQDYLDIEDFQFSRNQHSLQIQSHADRKNDYLKVIFNDISLEGLTHFLNPDEVTASGTINGFVELDELFGTPVLLADLEVVDLEALDMKLGHFTAKIENPAEGRYTLQSGLSGDDIDLKASGNMQLGAEGEMSYEGNLDLQRIDFKIFEHLSEKAIQNSSGNLSGQVEASGTAEQINYSGFLSFNAVQFEMTETGSVFSIPSERVDFSQADIVFNDFSIRDTDGNPTVIDGNIGIENPVNPVFDLSINSRNFKFLESTRDDNDLFFGKAIADLDIDLTGNLNLPIVRARVSLKRGTEVTTIIPESQVHIEEREGVVRIERRVDGQVVQDEGEDDEEGTPIFTGVDLEAIVNIDPAVIFRIVIDERAGDMLEVAGEANLSVDVDTRGNITMSGIYELNRGFYEMRMYEIVRRRFDLQSGSRLVWSGDPMEAEMQITAIYRLRTSALDLMADQLGGADDATRMQYRQELPFEVYLNMSGQLLRPDLEFRLDMPESSQGAMGGNIYNRIRQLNTMESERNTQVFALLVLGRFLPPGLASEEDRGFDAESMARSSASNLLSGQLNQLSERYIRGVDLDFDLESFTDYQTGRPEDRTQLSVRMRRSLLDERLTLQVGGQIDLEGTESEERQRATDILGDVSVEYRLTEDGRWSIRGFRQNQYEGILEGQVIVTGISLLFSRDFNSFAEIFSGKKKEDEKEED